MALKPEGASLRPVKRRAWCPGVEVLASDVALESHVPNCWSRLGYVCRMAAPRQEENRSFAATEGPPGKGDGGGSR